MSGESIKGPCARCGRQVMTDVPRVGLSFSPSQLASLARDTMDNDLRGRLICALETVDQTLANHTRIEIVEQHDARCRTCESPCGYCTGDRKD